MTNEDEPHFPEYCIQMFDGSVWLTKEGKITPNYDARGVWMTRAEAEAAIESAYQMSETINKSTDER